MTLMSSTLIFLSPSGLAVKSTCDSRLKKSPRLRTRINIGLRRGVSREGARRANGQRDESAVAKTNRQQNPSPPVVVG